MALQTHINVNHLGRRDFVCHHKDCTRSFGYKHLLRRHVTKAHPSERSEANNLPSVSDSEVELEDEPQKKSHVDFDIDMITGHSYAKQAAANLKSAKVLQCPYPDLTDLLNEEEIQTRSSSTDSQQCEYVFSRAYDLRRHLAASHSTILLKEIVDGWVKKQKRTV